MARRNRDGVSRDRAGGGRNPVIAASSRAAPLVGSDTASLFRCGRGAVCQRADCGNSLRDLSLTSAADVSMVVVAASAPPLLPQPQLHVQV